MSGDNDKPKPFDIDFQVRLRLDFNLAVELADLIIASKTENRALFSLAKQIKSQEDQG